MNNLTNQQKKYLLRCVEKNISLLDKDKDAVIISELEKINSVISDNSFNLEFNNTEEIFKDVDDCLEQLKVLTTLYSQMADLHILQEYDVIKKRMTSLLEYLATLKDMLNNDVMFNEDILKKEFKASISKLINEEQGVSLTQAEKLVYSDSRYSSLVRKMRPYVNYAQITKTKYDFFMKVLQNVNQSVSTASKELNNSRQYGSINAE